MFLYSVLDNDNYNILESEIWLHLLINDFHKFLNKNYEIG